MNEFKINFNKGFLSSGKDLVIDNITVCHPTIDMYWSLGDGFNCEDVYWQYVNILLCDPYTNMVELDDMGLNYLEQSAFDVFAMRWVQLSKLYNDNKQLYDQYGYNPLNQVKDALQFFLGSHNFELIYIQDEDKYYLIDADLKNDKGQYIYVISSDIYGIIVEFITLINCIDYSGRINPANETVRKMLIEDARDEINRKKLFKSKDENELDYIASAIDFLCVSDGSINYLNVGQYRIYQTLKSLRMKSKRIQYDHVLAGIYHGTIDAQKVKKEELTLFD